MRLQRKLFAMRSDTYKDLNEAETEWLEKKRSRIAKKFESKKKEILNDPNKRKSFNRKKFLEDLRKEAKIAEENIHGKDETLKKAVNNIWNRKQLEKAKAVELAKKKAAESAEKVAKLKKLGKGALAVGGTALGIGLGTKTIKNYKDRKKQEQTKNSVLGKK